MSSGLTVACDYVIHSGSASVLPHTLSALASFKMDNKKADHRPIALYVVEQAGCSVPVARSRVPKYDRQAVRLAATPSDPELQQQALALAEHRSSMPSIPVRREPTSHRFMVASYVLDGLGNISRYRERLRSRSG